MKMKMIWNKLKYWLQIFLVPLYVISYTMPRSKKIWVFGSTFGKRFADNPKYFYLYMNQYQNTEIRAVWILKKKEIVDLLATNNRVVFEWLQKY